jgi:drug/metabolite transporter (DMT)-like permease
MATATADASSCKAQGIALMVVAMLILPLTDGFAKYLSASYSPLFLGWARYAVACMVVLPLTTGIKGRDIFPSELIGTSLVGFFAFGEIPNAATIIGAGFIVAAGLALLTRSNGP